MSQRIAPPRLNADDLSTHDLCRLYRILDNLEETANMALQHVMHLDGNRTRVVSYVAQLQEYLSEERCNIVYELRARPNTADHGGKKRLSVLVQYEAWCEEFNKSTLSDLAAHPLSTEAI